MNSIIGCTFFFLMDGRKFIITSSSYTGCPRSLSDIIGKLIWLSSSFIRDSPNYLKQKFPKMGCSTLAGAVRKTGVRRHHNEWTKVFGDARDVASRSFGETDLNDQMLLSSFDWHLDCYFMKHNMTNVWS